MRKKDGRVRNKQIEEAGLWERLEVEPEQLQRHPTITPIIISSLDSIERAIEYLRGSDSKEAMELIRLWDIGSKKEHSIIPFEAYCLAAKSTPKQMIGILMEAVVEDGDRASEMMLAAAKSEVVKAVIIEARRPRGSEERRIILQNRGVLPSPKNQVFNNFGSISQDNRKQVANVSVGQLDEDNDKVSLAVERYNADRASGPAPVPVEVIDVLGEE